MATTEIIGFDLETLGLEKRAPSQILQVSMVYENPDVTKGIPVWELPNYTVFVDPGTINDAEIVALSMNGWIIDEIRAHRAGYETKYPVVTTAKMLEEATLFVRKHRRDQKNRPIITGANVGTFDLEFMPKEFAKEFHYRIWETGSFFANERGPMSLKDAKKAMGFPDVVHHDAWRESMDYILLLRAKLYGGNLTSYPV